MAKSYGELRKKLTPAQQTRSRELAAQMLAEVPLDQLRKSRKVTQVQMAKKLKIGQGSISKLESRSDAYISTLRSYIKALGGTLVMHAVFPDKTVNIELERQ
jgi:hypothetical protein